MASASRPDATAMLAHELRRRVAAVRVAGEAIAVLRDQGLDTTEMLDLLLAEVADLDELAVEVLGDRRDRRAEAGSEPAPAPATAPPDVAVTVIASLGRSTRSCPGSNASPASSIVPAMV